MSPHSRLSIALALSAALANAQYSPLTDRQVPYSAIPYKMDTIASGRGPQSGYNICNSTTAGPSSQCQTAFINSVEDWCVWGLPDPNSSVGDKEGEAVAFCTTDAHGTRVIPPGAVKNVQFLRTSQYIQITGNIDQTLLNIAADDSGGEMDPVGADKRGNPLGGLMYSTAFNNNSANPEQIIHWTNFMGANQFCLKACVNNANAPRNCEHVYDRTGCGYNVIADYNAEGFNTCDSPPALPVGIYVTNGATRTWYQPPEGQAINPPYVPSTPASSNCQAATSFPDAFNRGQVISSSAVQSSVASSASVSASVSGSVPISGSVSRSTSSPSASATQTGAAGSIAASAFGVVAALLGAVILI